MPILPAKSAAPVPLAPPALNGARWKLAVKSLDLSPQQTRIVELILQGKKDKQIATELRLSKHTVRTYLNRIFLRLDVTDRMELAMRVFNDCLKR